MTPEEKRAYNQKYYLSNRVVALSKSREYRVKNREEVLAKQRERSREYRVKNRELIAEYHREYRKKKREEQADSPNKKASRKRNPTAKSRETACAYQRKYRTENRLWIQAKRRVYDQRRIATNPGYAVSRRMRRRLIHALGGSRKAATTMSLVGCSAAQLRDYLESKFQLGMTWEQIHVDHVLPCNFFDLTDPVQQKACFHYTNLQPLFAKDNLKKSDTVPAITEEHFYGWMTATA